MSHKNNEIWVTTYMSEFYEVSNFGRVRSLTKSIKTYNGQNRTYSGKVLRQFLSNGYPTVAIGRKHAKVHRIFATAFLPNPMNLPCINHLDGNRANNSIENLEWCTYSQNSQHAQEAGLRIPGHKTNLASSIRVFDNSGAFLGEYESVKLMAQSLGFNYSSLTTLLNRGKGYKGYTFEYLKRVGHARSKHQICNAD